MRQDDSPSRQVVNGVEVEHAERVDGPNSSKLRYMFDYARFFVLVSGTLTARHFRRPYAVIQVNTMPDFLVFSTALPKLFGSRVVAYMHEPSPELAESLFGPGRVSRALARVEQWVLRFADHSIAVTDQLKERYVERGAKPEEITVVLNGADPESLLGDWAPSEGDADENVFLVVCHGSIEDRYGQDTIVEAARLLKPELPDLRVVIVGRGKATDALVAQIAEADVGRRRLLRRLGQRRPAPRAPALGRRRDRGAEGDALFASGLHEQDGRLLDLRSTRDREPAPGRLRAVRRRHARVLRAGRS